MKAKTNIFVENDNAGAYNIYTENLCGLFVGLRRKTLRAVKRELSDT